MAALPIVASLAEPADEPARHSIDGGWMRRLAAEFGSPALLVTAAGLGAAAGAFLLSQHLQPCDDAYITFRHARNLARYLRPAWNLEGRPVLGSTSPAFVFLLGGLGLVLGVDRIDQLAFALNAVLLAAITLLAYLVARDLGAGPIPALAAAALVGFNSVNVFILSQGFEAGLLLAVLMAGLYLARTGRDLPAVVLASAAPLVRPEGILLTPLVWGAILLGRRFRARLLAAYLALPLAWLVFSTAYYGSPIPQSIRARRAEPAVFRPYGGGRVDLAHRLASIVPEAAALARREASFYLLTGYRRLEEVPGGRLGPAWLTLLGLPVLGATLLRRPDARIVYLLYAPLFLALYGWIGHREAWYFPSFVTFGVLTLFHGGVVTLDRGWSLLKRITGFTSPWLPALSWTAVGALLLPANNYAVNHGQADKGRLFARDPRGEAFERAEHERFNGYRRVAGMLNRRGDPPEPALTSEVGVFGFFYRGEVIDTVGLCTPEALAFYPPPASDVWDERGRPLTYEDNLTPTRMVLDLKPTYVVNGLGFVRNLLQPGHPFRRKYVLLGSFGTAWGEPVRVFARKDAAAGRDGP